MKETICKNYFLFQVFSFYKSPQLLFFKTFFASLKAFAGTKIEFFNENHLMVWHKMSIKFWSGTKNLYQHKLFWDLQKDKASNNGETNVKETVSGFLCNTRLDDNTP